ncbi:predicted protein [Histoplasma capsulatum var. duboisii H88]|uniref:Predicted protein n=1 Tax=Ajellomyces capsulatus (strain H88) TaxID=544711 RepID=F0UM27_AJEC8|nr:predicted protein [Histoplasma capsulatum var. duboisii H88]
MQNRWREQLLALEYRVRINEGLNIHATNGLAPEGATFRPWNEVSWCEYCGIQRALSRFCSPSASWVVALGRVLIIDFCHSQLDLNCMKRSRCGEKGLGDEKAPRSFTYPPYVDSNGASPPYDFQGTLKQFVNYHLCQLGDIFSFYHHASKRQQTWKQLVS